MRDIFSNHYSTNYWADDESVSGHGSTLAATASIRADLPVLLAQYNINSMLDIPCGDLNWMCQVEFPEGFRYIGADIVPDLIAEMAALHQADLRVLDITRDKLPPVDLIFCRDLLGHFSNRDVRLALNNVRNSGAKYLLATTFPEHETNGDIETGQWRPINLASLFGLPDPIEYMREDCVEGGGEFSDKSLGLWRVQL